MFNAHGYMAPASLCVLKTLMKAAMMLDKGLKTSRPAERSSPLWHPCLVVLQIFARGRSTQLQLDPPALVLSIIVRLSACNLLVMKGAGLVDETLVMPPRNRQNCSLRARLQDEKEQATWH